MKILKRMMTVVLALCMTIGLCACGKAQSSSSGVKADKASKETTLSKCFSNDSNSIWYYIDKDDIENGVGKDSKILYAYVLKDGKCKRYDINSNKYTVGDFAQKSDDEIIQTLQETEKENTDKIEKQISDAKKGCDKLLASGVFDNIINLPDTEYGMKGTIKYDFTGVKKSMEQISEELDSLTYPENQEDFKMAIYTDSTGNKTYREAIVYNYQYIENISTLESLSKYADDSLDMTPSKICNKLGGLFVIDENMLVNSKAATFTKPITAKAMKDMNIFKIVTSKSKDDMIVIGAINPPTNAMQIYNSQYDGFICKDGQLITRIDSKQNYVLDSVGTDGIEVDPKGSDFPSLD